jgi:hypothetical protein
MASTLGFAAWLASPAAVQALPIIDDFDAPVGGQSVNIGTPTSTVTGLAGVEGGSRDLALTVQNTFGGGSQSTGDVNTAFSAGTLQGSSGPNVDTALAITWDASDAGLNADLSGFTGLALEGVFNDKSTSYKITVETFGGGTSSLTIGQAGDFSGNVGFSFASFVGSANLADVDRIVLEIDGARAADVSLDRLVAVPEPTTAAVLGLGLAGLAWMGRARRPTR